jgi:RecA/RadA recombinase
LARIASHPEFLRLIRTSSSVLQKAWAAGLSLTRGQWTDGYLEVELISEEVARVFQAVCENMGIRWFRFMTLNTFGEPRWKLSLRSRIDQQRAEKILWKDFTIPNTWEKFYSEDEDDNPPIATKTIEKALAILKTYDQPTADIDPEDTSKEAFELLLKRISPLPKKNNLVDRVANTLMYLADSRVTFDFVQAVTSGGKAECYDLSVPIGQHYAANGLVSHNSTVALHSCKEELAKHPDSVCLYMDFERAVPEEYVESMGLMQYDSRFFLVDPDSLEGGHKLVTDLFADKLIPSLVVVDSVAAATPQDLFGRDVEDTAPVAIRARKWAEILEIWSKLGGDYGTTFILLNQTRTKIITDKKNRPREIPGAIGAELEETPGGLAIKFYSSMRVRLEPRKVVMGMAFNPMTAQEEPTPVANLVNAFFIKNKLAAPFRKCSFYIQFGQGIDVVRTMIELAILRDFVTSSGRGKLALTLPSGKVLEGEGEEGLVSILRADEPAQQEMVQLLQWDQADKLAADMRAFQTVIPGQGVVTNVSELDAGVAAHIARNKVTASMIHQVPTIAEKAFVIGLVEKQGRAFVYKSPGGQEVRGGTISSLNDKLKGAVREALNAQIEAALQIIEEMAGQGEPGSIPDPVAPGIVGDPPAEEPLAVPENPPQG